MSAPKFICTRCGDLRKKLYGRCPACKSYNTCISIEAARERGLPLPAGLDENLDFEVVSSGIAAFDAVACKPPGIALGAVYLIAGTPGAGKSTLSIRLAGNIGRQGVRVVYALAESDRGFGLRIARYGIDPMSIQKVEPSSIEDLIEKLGDAPITVLDSLQGLAKASGQTADHIATAIDQDKKETGRTWIVIGHVTKDEQTAGTEYVQHIADATMELIGSAGDLRRLRVPKNRLCPTDRTVYFRMTEQGLVEVPDATSYMLRDRIDGQPGSIVAAVVPPDEHTAILVEVQAMITPLDEGEKPQTVCTGYPPTRLRQVLGILANTGAKIYGASIFVSVSGDLDGDQSNGLDLPVALALKSAHAAQPVDPKVCAWGELGLNGVIRRWQDEPRATETKRARFKPLRSRSLREAFVEAGLTGSRREPAHALQSPSCPKRSSTRRSTKRRRSTSRAR